MIIGRLRCEPRLSKQNSGAGGPGGTGMGDRGGLKIEFGGYIRQRKQNIFRLSFPFPTPSLRQQKNNSLPRDSEQVYCIVGVLNSRSEENVD